MDKRQYTGDLIFKFIASLEKDRRLSEVRENRDVIVGLLFNYDVAISQAVRGGEVDLDENRISSRLPPFIVLCI